MRNIIRIFCWRSMGKKEKINKKKRAIIIWGTLKIVFQSDCLFLCPENEKYFFPR